MPPLSLRTLLAGVDSNIPADIETASIAGLTVDSRQAGEGFVFVALKGSQYDGHDFLEQAMGNGARAALVEKENQRIALPQLVVNDTRQALALAAMNLYGRPGREMNIIGITGTNGKTTTAYLLEALLGADSGLMGTVEVSYAHKRLSSNMTTPDPLMLAARLADMRKEGVRNLVMEVSSHALEQRRVDGLDFSGAIFTNLSRDHLDYHCDMDNYFAAKKRLFSQLLPQGRQRGKKPWAVVNLEDGRGEELLEALRSENIPAMTYGAGGQVRAYEVRYSLDGTQALVDTPQGGMSLNSRLVGEFNLQNLMAAAAAGLCMGISLNHISRILAQCGPVPGRLERVNNPQGPIVLVDYAHSDDSLRKVLGVLKPLSGGRLICLFGAGGNRDQGKRPLMGRAVAEMADIAIVTSDNPRLEEPRAIIDMIIPGLRQGGMRAIDAWSGEHKTFLVEADREKAINLAISQAAANDVVLIAGKGHENYQTIGRDNIRFDDREKAVQALRGRVKDHV